MRFRRVAPFTRRRGRLPGQSSDDELGVDIRFIVKDDGVATIIERELIQIGRVGDGDYVQIDADGIHLYANGVLHIDLQSDGSLDLGEAALTAGNGAVTLDDDGITLNPGTGASEKLKVISGTVNIVELYGQVLTGAAAVANLYAQGIDATTPDATIQLNAQDYDGSTGVTVELATASDRLTLTAGTVRIAGTLVINELGGTSQDLRAEGDTKTHLLFVDASADAVGINESSPHTSTSLDVGGTEAVRLPRLTTTERDNLTAAAGMVIFNTTTGNFEGYDGSSWNTL